MVKIINPTLKKKVGKGSDRKNRLAQVVSENIHINDAGESEEADTKRAKNLNIAKQKWSRGCPGARKINHDAKFFRIHEVDFMVKSNRNINQKSPNEFVSGVTSKLEKEASARRR